MTNIQCDTFVPIYGGKGVKIVPWLSANETALGKSPSPEEHYTLGMALFKGSLESLTPRFLELGVCTQRDVDLALKRVQQVEDDESTPYQICSIPGGMIYQWWATKV